MKQKQGLVAFLDEYLPWMEAQIPSVSNEGGCAVFALHLHDALTNMHKESSLVAVLHQEKEIATKELSNLMKFINTGSNDTSVTEDHVMVKVDDVYFDIFGLHEMSATGKVMGRKVVDLPKPLLLSQLEHGHTNPLFAKKSEALIKHLLWEMPKAFSKWIPGEYQKLLQLTVEPSRSYAEQD